MLLHTGLTRPAWTILATGLFYRYHSHPTPTNDATSWCWSCSASVRRGCLVSPVACASFDDRRPLVERRSRVTSTIATASFDRLALLWKVVALVALSGCVGTTLARMGDEYKGVVGTDLVVDGWFHERGVLWPGQAMSLKVEQILDHHRSDFQDILVFRSSHHGTILVLDGVIQVTERDEFAYQEMIAHIPLFAHPDPKRVLCIGGGDGGVLREIARHEGVEQIVICEIDKDVIDVSKQFLPNLAVGFDDPRVVVHIGDGAQYLHDNPNTFDVIITDSSDPVGPASVLFETPFFQSMHASLRNGGIVCTQGECMWLHLNLIQPLVTAIAQTYSTVEYAYTSLPSYPSGQIGFIVATKGRGSCHEAVRTPDAETQAKLQCYTPDLHKAAFVLPAFAKRAIFGS